MSNETPPFRDHPAVRAVIGFGRVPDAVDAAIERHRAARDELQRATGDADAASNADGAAWADLLATRPGDVPGAVRLLRYVSDSPASEVVEDPQDLLRQLLAVVEAAEAGGPVGEGAPAGAEPQAVAEPDPALAVVAEYRAAWDGLGAAIEAVGGAGVPEVPEAEAADSAAYARLRAVRPTTPAGFRALAETWAWRLRAERIEVEDGEPGSTASHAAASLIAGAGVCLPGSTDAPVSPALAELIARHRDLVRQSEARGLSDTEADPLFDEAWSVFRQACSFPIAGPADLAAKVDLMAAEITDGLERGRSEMAAHAWRCLRADLSSFGLLDSLGVVSEDWAHTVAGGLPHADGTVTYWDVAGDAHRKPVAHWIGFVAMQLHCRAQIEMTRRREAYGDPPGEEIDRLEAQARRELRLDALSDFAFRPDRVFRAAEALRTGRPGNVEPAARSDAPLLALGDEFMAERAASALDAAALVSAIEAEWRTWAGLHGVERDEAGDAAFEASCERRDALLDAAEALPAVSREARHAKALARTWVDWVEDERPGRARGVYSSEGRLVFDIHASLSAATGERVERLRVAPLDHDLAGLPVEQLGHLYDALLPFEDLIGRAENAPCFWEGEGLRTVAGDIIYREAARLEGILKAIAKEIESRVPADDSEREIRLATLLRHRMLGGGLPTSRALLTEALAACED